MNESNNKALQLQNACERPLARVYDFYLTGTITDAKEYQDWNQLMRQAGENDAVIIHINSSGGEIFTAIQLMRSISQCPATVVASVEGMCMSAATLIFLCADVCEISDHSHFMFHTYSSGNWGKGHEQLESVMADNKWATQLFKQVYKDFLTDKEIEEMIRGKDYWMTPDQVTKRLELRNKAANKKSKGPKTTKSTLQKVK